MPLFYNDNINDELAYDSMPYFNGGMDNRRAPSDLQPTQCADLQNLDWVNNSLLQTRRGTELIGAAVGSGRIEGLAYFDTTGLEQLLASTGTSVYKSTGSSWTLVSGFSPTSGSAVNMVQGVDKMYMTDGIQAVQSYNGTSFSVMDGTSGVSTTGVQFLEWHTSRLFAAGKSSALDTVYVSNFLDASVCSSVNSLRIGGGEGDAITGLRKWDNFNLLVFKERSTYLINADPTTSVANWQVQLIHSQVGCVSHRSAVQVGNDIWFLSRQGVRSVNRLIQETQREINQSVSEPIQGLIERINWTYATKCNAAYWNNRYILSVPLDSATDCNYALVFNTLTQSWSGYWTGFNATQMITGSFTSQNKLYFGDSAGQVRRWRDYVAEADAVSTDYLDEGVTPVATILTSRGLSFADPLSPKTGFHAEIEFYKSEATVTTYVILDEGLDVSVSSFLSRQSGSELPISLPFYLTSNRSFKKGFDIQQYGQFRIIQLKCTSSMGKVSLRNLKGSAFLDTIQTVLP